MVAFGARVIGFLFFVFVVVVIVVVIFKVLDRL